MCFVSCVDRGPLIFLTAWHAAVWLAADLLISTALQAAATSETRRKEGDASTTGSTGSEDEPVSEEDALDIQELLKKAITSSAV